MPRSDFSALHGRNPNKKKKIYVLEAELKMDASKTLHK